MNDKKRSIKCNVFVSYARKDNEYDDSLIERSVDRLRQAMDVRLRGEIRFFFDKQSIEWGDVWKDIINRAISDSTFLLPFVSPAYISSTHCFSEWSDFKQLEQSLATNNLITPIYYRSDREFDMAIKDPTTASPIIEDLSQRNYIDWSGPDAKKRLKNDFNSVLDELSIALEKRVNSISSVFLDSLSQDRSRLISGRSLSTKKTGEIDEGLRASTNMKYNSLSVSQKLLFRIIYGQPNDGEALLDDLYKDVSGEERLNISSHRELYYRLKDLWHQSLIDMKSVGERKTLVKRIDEIEDIALRDKLLERSLT